MNETPPDQQEVYVIQHKLGPVKIGRAKNPEQRLRDIQVSCPFDLFIKKTVRPSNAKVVEEYLHERFQKYRMRGEWFDIPVDERDFEIPTHVNELGMPNVPVEVTPGRDMNREWAEAFERLSRAMKISRYRTNLVDDLQEQWRDVPGFAEGEEDDDSDSLSRPDLEEIEEDAPKGKHRCTSCGHYYDLNEQGCPKCGSGDFTDSGRLR